MMTYTHGFLWQYSAVYHSFVGMESKAEGGMLEQKGVEFVLGQSMSGHKTKDAELLTSNELDDGRMTMDCLYRGGTADSEQETSDIEDAPLQ